MTIGASPPEGSSRIEQLGVADDALADGEDLLLPAGQPRGHLAAPLGELGEHGVDAVELRAVAAGRARVGADEQVVLDRQGVEDAVAFQHLHHAGLDDVARAGRG